MAEPTAPKPAAAPANATAAPKPPAVEVHPLTGAPLPPAATPAPPPAPPPADASKALLARIAEMEAKIAAFEAQGTAPPTMLEARLSPGLAPFAPASDPGPPNTSGETVPGGRFVVGGVEVDAHGNPLKKDEAK